MKKTILSALLGTAIPLVIAFFAFYEIYRETGTIVLRSELNTFKGTMDSIRYEKNSTVFYFHEGNKVIFFSSRPTTNELYDTIQKDNFFDEDTFTVQYANKNQQEELIAFERNNKKIVSYEEYYNYMQAEIDGGPKAAAIAFSIISCLLFIIIILFPAIEKSTRKSVHNELLKIKGIKVIKENKYELEMNGYRINLTYELKMEFRKDNPSHIKIQIYLPESLSNSQLKNIDQEFPLENTGANYFYEMKYQSFFKPLYTTLVKKIKKGIEDIESVAYSVNKEKKGTS